MKRKLFVFLAIYGEFYYQRCSLKFVLQKLDQILESICDRVNF